MRGRVGKVFGAAGEFLRVIGTSLSGVMPAMRSADGTFGTQRAQGTALGRQRAETYPHD